MEKGLSGLLSVQVPGCSCAVRVGISLLLWLGVPGLAGAACAPCSFQYALKVRYGQGGSIQIGDLIGAAQIHDTQLDLDLGAIQSLLTAQVGSAAQLQEVIQISLDGTAGELLPASDVLLASGVDVIAWVSSPTSAAARLHASTFTAQSTGHAFTYTLTARGTESPPVTFSYTLTAVGNETYEAPAHKEVSVIIDYFKEGKECRSTEGDVCLDPLCKRTSSHLDEYSSSSQLEHEFYDVGDRCAHFKIKVGSTNFRGKTCDRDLGKCWGCGAWYKGTVVLDGICSDVRSWSRSTSGIGQVEAKPDQKFTITYSAAGGVLGSGLPATTGLFGTPTYAPLLSNCKVVATPVGIPVSCSHLSASMKGPELTVSTGFYQIVTDSKSGANILSSSEGIKFFSLFPFSTENEDVVYGIEVTFLGNTYHDLNSDGFVDVGPFSLWMTGPAGDQLWGAFDRSAVPVAVIDSILPNPALLGDLIQFTGHSVGGTTNKYTWLTHQANQQGGQQLSTQPSFSRSDIKSGIHQIRFQVTGLLHASPYDIDYLTVNQPPVAFINQVENIVDPFHPKTALLLRDGTLPDPFQFDGGGIDFDGSVQAYEWSSDLEPGGVIGTSNKLQRPLTSVGTHTISLRVRDDAGVWSTPVTTKVTVRRPPVLLVHGLCGDNSTWDDTFTEGWLGPQWPTGDLVRQTFDPNGDGLTNDSPADISIQIAQQIQAMKQQYDVRTVNVVAHSMGGLSTRAYVQGPGFQVDVNKLVMLGTPNHGSSLADLALFSNGYSQEDVELYIPSAKVRKILRGLGVVVDVLDALNILEETVVCYGQESDALHALRPHGDFVRNLNRSFKDEGTEDFGSSGEPDDRISTHTEYFVIDGTGLTLSHTHLPRWIEKAIAIATLGEVNLAHMELLWIRAGDLVVADRSAHLDNVPSQEFERRHMKLEHTGDSMGQALEYLLDDPPAPPPGQPGLDSLLGAQILAADWGNLPAGVSFVPPRSFEVDAAARRLRVGLSWQEELLPTGLGEAEEDRRGERPLTLILTSPSGVRYESVSPGTPAGFEVIRRGRSLEVTIENPEPGLWNLDLLPLTVVPRSYTWLAAQESGTFLAVGISADRVDPGQSVTLAAYLQKGGAAVTGATVYAAVAPPTGRPQSLPLHEDSRFDGLYVGEFTPENEGIYRVLTAAEVTVPGGETVGRVGFTNFSVRALPDVTVEIAASAVAPRHGETVRLTATVHNRGKGAAQGILVQIFDGRPQEGGRLLAQRAVDLPPNGTATVSAAWFARAGAHRLVAVADPTNRAQEPVTEDNVAELAAIVADLRPPIARAGADQVSALGQNVIFDGRASMDDDQIVSYRWEPIAGAAGSVSFVLEQPYTALVSGFPAVGDYRVRLTVMDASGNVGSDELTVRVVDDFDTGMPVAAAGPDRFTVMGAPLQLDGTNSRDDYGIARATWDVDLARDSDGDGSPGNDVDLVGLTPTLADGYARPGIFRVRLTVNDAAGNGPVTDDLLVTVGRPAAHCTLTVSPGGDVNHALAQASTGDTICLLPARYDMALEISQPGVTLDGQGAILDGTDLYFPNPLTPGLMIRQAEDSGLGVTVRNLTVRGFFVAFYAEPGVSHQLETNRAENCWIGFFITANASTLKRNRVDGCPFGYVVDGANNLLVDNTARGGSHGILLLGSRHRLEGNQSCGNSTADISRGLDGNAPVTAQPGRDNACDRVAGWSDIGSSGCTFRCDSVRHPASGQVVDADTYFEPGIFELGQGLVIDGNGIQVHLAGTELVGPGGEDAVGIEIRSTGARVSGGTLAGFGRGLVVESADDIIARGLTIGGAVVAVEIHSGSGGQLQELRGEGSRVGLLLRESSRGWTVEESLLRGGAGQGEGGATMDGSGHILRNSEVHGGLLVRGASHHLLDNVVTAGRSGHGIALLDAVSIELRGNTVRNGLIGLLLTDGRSHHIISNEVVGARRGILLEGGSLHDIASNRVVGALSGIELDSSRSNNIRGNTVSAREGHAILLTRSTENRIQDNEAIGSLYGISLESADKNRIEGNRFAGNRLPDIALQGSTGNLVTRNIVNETTPDGILSFGSIGNSTDKNQLLDSDYPPRQVATLGVSLAGRLGEDSIHVGSQELERGVALAWEGLRAFTDAARLDTRWGFLFFQREAEAVRVFQRLATDPLTPSDESQAFRAVAAQIAKGAELAARRTLEDAQHGGGSGPLLEEAENLLREGIRQADAGHLDLAIESFGQSWSQATAAIGGPVAIDIPTLSSWGLLILSLILTGVAFLVLSRKG